MAFREPENAAFSGYDLSCSPSHTNGFHHRSDDHSFHSATNNPNDLSPQPTRSVSDPDSWFSNQSRHTDSPSGAMPAAAAHANAPFEVPKLWREAMQCVSINANLYPQQILHKYHDLLPSQAALHRGLVELDVWRSKRATERGVRLVQVRYLDGDPARIYLMVIFVDDGPGPPPGTAGKKPPVVRLVTGTSARHVLEEPCANCPLWLRIIPCCDRWAESVDFDGPVSAEEKQVPAVVTRLVEEVRRKNLLLHAKEREIEAKDDQLRRLREDEGRKVSIVADAAPALEHDRPKQLHGVDLEMLEQYWWVAAVFAIALVVLILK
ncbi:hypothetical protein VPNG_07399 [Cytospora leucostoma]|uniref:Uncharacterized protein n=1 Tax=Cytospora leucostoma TaxID=1230097 RepID=A0A423WMI1_9PEZI|nr:hypothetical protein VPNG_07399 [Cytospora leucostoma]